MRLTLKAVGVIPVWVAAHCQVFPANIFVRGRDPQRRVPNNSGGLSQFRHVPLNKDAWSLSTALSALRLKNGDVLES